MTYQHEARDVQEFGLGSDPDRYYLELFVAMLQGWFNTAVEPNHEFYFEPHIEQTKLHIRGEAPVQYETFHKACLLTCVWGPSMSQNMAIGDFAFQREDGTMVYDRLESGTIVVYAVAQSMVQAKRLARAAHMAALTARHMIERPGGFHSVARQPVTLNSPSPPGALILGAPEHNELVMVQINIPVEFQINWSIGVGRSAPQSRNLAMVLEPRARDYLYPQPEVLRELHLGDLDGSNIPERGGINLVHRNIRLLTGPGATHIGSNRIVGFQQADLTTPSDEE
jgi:hypothetical protein